MSGASCRVQIRAGSLPGLNHSRWVVGHHSLAMSPVYASMVRLTNPTGGSQADAGAVSFHPFR